LYVPAVAQDDACTGLGFGISTISVTPLLWLWCLSEALVRVVFVSGDERHRAAVGIAGVGLRLGPRVEVGVLEERQPGGR
jgi:hypothetical protein